jgi:hypothetical protein
MADETKPAEIDPIKAAAAIKLVQAGAQTGAGQAGSGSGVQETGAGAGTTGAGAGAQGRAAAAQAETGMDVGQAEAYVLNMKRLVAQELNTDAHLQAMLTATIQRLTRNAEDQDRAMGQFTNNMVTLGQTAIANAVALSNRVNNNAADSDKHLSSLNHSERERTIRDGDLLDVVREAGVSADTTVFQDAIEAAVAKAVAKALSKPA